MSIKKRNLELRFKNSNNHSRDASAFPLFFAKGGDKTHEIYSGRRKDEKKRLQNRIFYLIFFIRSAGPVAG